MTKYVYHYCTTNYVDGRIANFADGCYESDAPILSAEEMSILRNDVRQACGWTDGSFVLLNSLTLLHEVEE